MFSPVEVEVLPVLKEQAQGEVFRLEYRRFYDVEADRREFEKWKRGEKTAADDPNNSYWVELRALRERGVRSRRVRVVDFPISDYLRYEIDFYRGSEVNGEEVLLVERAPTIDCMQSTVVTQDFWLFDDRVALLWKYDKHGRRAGQEEATDDSSVGPYRNLRECLLRRALPMDEFIARYADSFSVDGVAT